MKGGTSNKKSKDDFFPVHTNPNGGMGNAKRDLLPIIKKGGKKPSKPKLGL